MNAIEAIAEMEQWADACRDLDGKDARIPAERLHAWLIALRPVPQSSVVESVRYQVEGWDGKPYSYESEESGETISGPETDIIGMVGGGFSSLEEAERQVRHTAKVDSKLRLVLKRHTTEVLPIPGHWLPAPPPAGRGAE